MASSPTSVHWESVAAVPFENVKKFNAVLNEKENCLVAINDQGEIFRFASSTNTWHRYKISNHPQELKYMTIAIDSKSVLYILTCNAFIATLKLEEDASNKWQSQSIRNSYPVINGNQAIMINDELHIIGGYNSYDGSIGHHKYNQNTQKLELVQDFCNDIVECRGIKHHRIVKVDDKIFMFGGLDYMRRCNSELILEYDVKRNVWNKLKIKMPIAVNSFGCTSILNGEYIVLLGGYGGRYRDEIFIYSVKDEKFKKCRIKCPKKAQYHAFTMNDTKLSNLSVFGFVTYEWKNCKIPDHLFPPRYLINIMVRYYGCEYVHLLNMHDGEHWEIDVFDLIS